MGNVKSGKVGDRPLSLQLMFTKGKTDGKCNVLPKCVCILVEKKDKQRERK